MHNETKLDIDYDIKKYHIILLYYKERLDT